MDQIFFVMVRNCVAVLKDVRDFISLTEQKMSLYLIVNARCLEV